jgi:hypothetical protein
VESHSRIGIYLRKDRATVVCLASQGRETKLLDSFCVTAEDQEQQSLQVLADQIAKECSERRIKIAEACVALDCTLFMQHRIHSDFSDVKKIAATIRFDTEETLSTDVSDLAVTFRVVSSNDGGSDLDVFTAERSVLTDILLSLQSNGTDPLTIEPDVHLLSQYLVEASVSRHGEKESALYALLSDRRGYLIGIAGSRVTMVRAFPVSPSQDRNELLSREILLGAALAGLSEPPQKLYVADVKGDVNIRGLQAKAKVPVEMCDPAALMGAGTSNTTGSPNAIDFAIAFGAALPGGEAERVNFRSDHMPHLGKKMRLHNAVLWCSLAVTILVLTLGVYKTTEYLKVKQAREKVMDSFEPKYVAVMRDKGRLPKTIKDGLTNLQGLQRRIQQEKNGAGSDQESVSAKLTLVWLALNSCAAATDLKVESIEISGTRIAVTGNTSSRANTDKVFAAMPTAKLELGPHSYTERNGRDTFTMTLKPIKDTVQKPAKEAEK